MHPSCACTLATESHTVHTYTPANVSPDNTERKKKTPETPGKLLHQPLSGTVLPPHLLLLLPQRSFLLLALESGEIGPSLCSLSFFSCILTREKKKRAEALTKFFSFCQTIDTSSRLRLACKSFWAVMMPSDGYSFI